MNHLVAGFVGYESGRVLCDCAVCQRSRRLNEIIKRGDVTEMGLAIDELLNALIETEEELAMQKAAVQSPESPQAPPDPSTGRKES